MILRTAFRNLGRNTRRTLAVGITVGMGTASLFVFHGFNHGIMHQYQDNCIHARYGHGQVNSKGYRDQVYEKPWERWIQDWRQTAKTIGGMPGVVQVFPRIEFFSLLTNGRITVSGRGQGVDGPEEAKFFNTMNIEQGVTLSNQQDGIFLGRGLARALDVHPGDRVTLLASTVHGSLNAADLYVTGIFHTGAKEFDDVVFRIPLPQAQALLDTDRVESIAVGLQSQGWEKDWSAVSTIVGKDYPQLEAVPFAVLDKVYYQNSVDWLNSQFGIIETIILAIVILGIFNTVSTGIMERKQEIGNLRANGESVWDVTRLLAAEGLVLGVIAALTGIILTWILNATLLKNGILMPPAPGLTRQFYVRIELVPMMAVKTFLMGAGVALLATFAATWKTVRLPIGEALRSL